MASIQPALQKAIGSSSTAKIQVIITDKDDEVKKPDNKLAEQKSEKDKKSDKAQATKEAAK